MESTILGDEQRGKEASRVTWIGFIVNALLTLLKIFAGIQGKSAAMLADGIHSLSDFFTDIVVLVGFRFTGKPEDDEHNYGHGKYETLATVIIGVALLFVGYNILTSGIKSVYAVLFQGVHLEKPGGVALIAAIVSIVGKEWLYRFTCKVGERINSPAVIANGWHHRSDAFSSIGTLIGISGAIVLGNRWTLLDPIASIIVSVFIFKVAFEILSPAVDELLEHALDSKEIDYIEKAIKSCPEILNYHHLRTRRIGPRVAVEMHLMFSRHMTIEEAHHHATAVEDQIKARFGNRSIITTHLEPLDI